VAIPALAKGTYPPGSDLAFMGNAAIIAVIGVCTTYIGGALERIEIRLDRLEKFSKG
jgi:hypothetical protein